MHVRACDHRILPATDFLPRVVPLRSRQQITWDWYCLQSDPVSQLLRRLVVGWLPALLINLWQGMVLPLVFTLVVQVRFCDASGMHRTHMQ